VAGLALKAGLGAVVACKTQSSGNEQVAPRDGFAAAYAARASARMLSAVSIG